MKIAYLCAQYPAISHTFILREVEALRRLDVEIDTFSVRRADLAHLFTDADRDAFASTFAIRPPRWQKVLEAHLRVVLRAPIAYLATLLKSVRLAPPGVRGLVWQFFYLTQAVVMWDECRARGISHIHAHLANVSADIALLAAHLGTASALGERWSWSFTMHGPTEFADVGRFRLGEKLHDAKWVVCISDYARSQLMALSSPAEWNKLRVVRVGLPVEQFAPDMAGDRAEGELTILCVGRLVAEKGQAILLEATALLVARDRPVTVVIAGEGPWRDQLEAVAKSLGIAPHVCFVGPVGQDEIRALYAASPIFCLPSFAEGIPVVLMEAMAMGCAVVSTRITGIPELIDDGHNGLLVTPGATGELADALERLLDDPGLRRDLGASAREKVLTEFDVSRSAELLKELFVEHDFHRSWVR